MTFVLAGARRPARGLVLVVLTVLLCSGLCASSAWAGKGVVSVFGASGSGDGQFANAFGTAVNLSSGDVYVVDQGNDRVEQFDASGGFVRAWGWGVADGNAAFETCTSGCQAGQAGSGNGQLDGPQGIAIDQSGGSVYVVDANNNRVEKFSATGAYLSQFGSAGSAEGQFSGPQGVAVDPSDGSVYVADANNNRVEKFDSAGAFVRTFGWGVADGNSAFETCTSSCQPGLAGGEDGEFSGPTRVAVDSSGRVYVLDAGNGRIERFTSASAFDQVFDPTDVFVPQEIAIGGNDHLYVAQFAQDFSEQRVVEIDAAGTLVDTHGVGSTAGNSSGLALSASDQKIYLADGFNARVFIMDDVTPPTVTIDPATSVTSTSASLSGAVTPNGSPNVGWRFETSTDDANWTPVAADQDAGNGNSPVPVSQDLTGLVPNTTYFVRLAATRPFNAQTNSSETQLTTTAIPPDVTTTTANDIAPDHATLDGLVNPNNSPTTYYFQYGPTTAYGASVPATQDGDAGSADALGIVMQRLSALQPGTTYHYRLVATNQAGTIHGTDQTFTTTTPPAASTPRPEVPGAGFLPDQRGWEKVSPADKNGGDVLADSQRMRAAANGDAVSFASLVAFGDAIGTNVATDYVSVRGADGWSTHAVTPHQAPASTKAILAGLQSFYTGAFSSDLTKGVFLGWSPVTSDANVAQVANVYRRDDLTTPGPGSYQLLSACPLCASTHTPLAPMNGNINGAGAPFFAGASSDFGHVIFESQEPLTSDAPSGCTDLTDVSQCPANVYEWDHGTVRLAGILPDSACGSPPCTAPGSQAGQGAGGFQRQPNLTPHTISADGSRIFFTVPEFPGSAHGALYMRVDHTTTAQLNASERATPDPGGPRPATYWDASADGRRVFFTSPEALTDDAPVDGDVKLYMYDSSKPDSDPHNLTLVSADGVPGDPADVQTVLGTNSDGHYVYFAAAGQLVAGQPFLGLVRALYVWHDGTIRYIATMGPFVDALEDTTAAEWNGIFASARVTPDGVHLLFSSTLPGARLTGYDQGHCHDVSLDAGCRELYVYSYASQRLACASCNPSGAPATADAFTGVRVNNGAATTSPALDNAMTDDGRRVFFSTAEALVPQDVNERMDAYEYDVPSGTVHLLTSGRDRFDSFFVAASSSGDDVFVLTRQQLVRADGDNNYDLYDARVGGGFTEPPATAATCSGDACQGPQSSAPAAVTPGSSLVTGSAKPKPKARAKPKRCRRGSVRKKVRGRTTCVKPHKKHKAKRAKRAQTRGRAK
jgi:DNA-binding beta-propeller fold protein YncE